MKKTQILIYGVFLLLSSLFWYASGKRAGYSEYKGYFDKSLDSLKEDSRIYDRKVDSVINETREYIIRLEMNKDIEQFKNHSQIKP